MNAIEITFFGAELAFALIWIACRAIICTVNKRFDVKMELMLLLMYVNIAVIMRYVMFPFEKTADGHVQPLILDTAAMFPPRLNLVPLVNIADFEKTGDLLLNIIGNAAMFIPTGIVLPVCCKRFDSFGKTVLGGAALSLCIEIFQLPFAVRVSDVDDLILNTLGAAIGAGIYFGIRHAAGAKKRKAAAV